MRAAAPSLPGWPPGRPRPLRSSGALGWPCLLGVGGGPIVGSLGRTTATAVAGTALVLAGVAVAALNRGHRDDEEALLVDAQRDAVGHPPRPAATADRADGRAATAAVFAGAEDGAAVQSALAGSGVTAQLTAEPADALAAIVRGATLLVVDGSRPESESLLHTVRRRIDDGWSDCAVVAFFPPWDTVDVELSSSIDAVARYPITPGDLDVAVRVARSQSGDRRPARDLGRFPPSPRPRLA